MPADLATLAADFHRLHRRGDPVLLPNAWDAASARIVEEAGATAIATTSSGVAWSLGKPDGEAVTRDEMLDVVRRIARTVRVPVTADVERGYGSGSPADVATTVRAVLDAGAVGVNLEDGEAPGRLTDTATQAARLTAARETADAAGVSLFVNARIDTYLFAAGENASRFDETVRRAAAYVAAGANGIFVPGVYDAATIGRLTAAIDAPINVLAMATSPNVAELKALGVARVSLGGGTARAALGAVQRLATAFFRDGSYDGLANGVTNANMNALFEGR